MAKRKESPRGVPTRAEFREVIARAIAEHAGPVKALRGRALVDELVDEVLALVLDRRRRDNAARSRSSRRRLAAERSERRRAA